MKKVAISMLCCLFISVLASGQAHASQTNQYAPYSDFQELKAAYIQAIDSGDTDQQREIYNIAKSTLESEVESANALLENVPALTADQDEQYWAAQFPKLFASGNWISRDTGISLSLNPYTVVSHGTQADAARGWNSVYAKFHRDHRWKNTKSMEGQCYCHYRNAKVKPQWNIEPWRTSFDPVFCN